MINFTISYLKIENATEERSQSLKQPNDQRKAKRKRKKKTKNEIERHTMFIQREGNERKRGIKRIIDVVPS